MIVTVHHNTRYGDEWGVWAQLSPGDPIGQGESFMIGYGATRDEALRAAVKELEDAVDVLQGPPAATIRAKRRTP